MIKIFGATDTNFTSNGDIVIQPMKAKVHKEDNGDYYLDLECGLEYLDYIVENKIVVAPVATTYEGQADTQAFRVHNVTVTNNKITAKCRHVFWDSKGYFISSTGATNVTMQQALTNLNANTDPSQNIFVSTSDITATGSFAVNQMSLFDAVQKVKSYWGGGGHMYYNNWAYGIFSAIGEDRGVNIRYGANLQEISKTENWDDVVTKMLPTGKDGIKLNYVDPSAAIWLTSETQYAVPYTKTVAFDQSEIKRSSYESESAYKSALVQDLRAKATAYLADHCVPVVNYTLKAYADFPVDIGDTIRVIDEPLGMDLLTTVISFDYDCLTDRCENIQFGNFMSNAKGMGTTVKTLAANNNAAVIGGKQLQFNDDNSVSWLNWS